jgi:hypothetical protein
VVSLYATRNCSSRRSEARADLEEHVEPLVLVQLEAPVLVRRQHEAPALLPAPLLDGGVVLAAALNLGSCYSWDSKASMCDQPAVCGAAADEVWTAYNDMVFAMVEVMLQNGQPVMCDQPGCRAVLHLVKDVHAYLEENDVSCSRVLEQMVRCLARPIRPKAP